MNLTISSDNQIDQIIYLAKLASVSVPASQMKALAAFLYFISLLIEYLWILDCGSDKTNDVRSTLSGC